jgi:LPXTG-motif cell wall-anchored protein
MSQIHQCNNGEMEITGRGTPKDYVPCSTKGGEVGRTISPKEVSLERITAECRIKVKMQKMMRTPKQTEAAIKSCVDARLPITGMGRPANCASTNPTWVAKPQTPKGVYAIAAPSCPTGYEDVIPNGKCCKPILEDNKLKNNSLADNKEKSNKTLYIIGAIALLGIGYYMYKKKNA